MLASFSSTNVGDDYAHILTVPSFEAVTQSRLGLCPSPSSLSYSRPPWDCPVSLIKMALQLPGCSKQGLLLDILTTVMPGLKQDLWAQGEGDLGYLFIYLMFVYFWERETECEQGRNGVKETQNLKQAPGFELSAQSPMRGSNPRAVGSWPEPKSED